MKKWLDKNNDPVQSELLLNKEKTLVKFAKYMKRDWCGCEYNNTMEKYEDFSRRHPKGIVKPLLECGGHGIELVDTQHAGGNLYLLYRKTFAY